MSLRDNSKFQGELRKVLEDVSKLQKDRKQAIQLKDDLDLKRINREIAEKNKESTRLQKIIRNNNTHNRAFLKSKGKKK